MKYMKIKSMRDRMGIDNIMRYELVDSNSIFANEEYKAIVESANPKNEFSKINGLREKHIPLKLYRYCPLKEQDKEGIKRLESDLMGRVYFSSPNKYNDVLEVPVKEQSQQAYRAGYRGQGGASEKDLREVVLMACFSERWNNSAMWHHYASWHKGFCIEYDMTKLYDMGSERKTFPATVWGSLNVNEGQSHLLSLFPVLYSDYRYFCDNFNEYRDVMLESRFDEMVSEKANFLREMIPAYLVKTLDWENEKEWRMLWPKADFYYDNTLFIPENNCIDLSFCVTKVILGLYADNEIVEKVKDMAKDMNYSVTRIEIDREKNILKEKVLHNFATYVR